MENEMKTTLEIMQKTIEEMPDMFTSREFNAAAIKNGYPKRLIKGRGLASFISRFADNEYYRSKRWIKKSARNISEPIENKDLELEKAIEILKKHGYKIMKPVNDWIEC